MASEAIQALARRAQSYKSALDNRREREKASESRAYTVGEVALGAAGAGAIDGYFGSPSVGGVPLTAGLGALAALAGLAGLVPGGMHVAAVGIGAVAGPLYAKTFQKAAEASQKAAEESQ